MYKKIIPSVFVGVMAIPAGAVAADELPANATQDQPTHEDESVDTPVDDAVDSSEESDMAIESETDVVAPEATDDEIDAATDEPAIEASDGMPAHEAKQDVVEETTDEPAPEQAVEESDDQDPPEPSDDVPATEEEAPLAVAQSEAAVARVTEVVPAAVDSQKPTTELVSPAPSAHINSAVEIVLKAHDDVGLQTIVANIYRDGSLYKSTQTPMHGATAGTHTATVDLPSGTYSIKYNSKDVAGNVSTTNTIQIVVDTVAPEVSVKPGLDAVAGPYSSVSFKLHDAVMVDRLMLNGVAKDFSDSKWSDLNDVRPGRFGAVGGVNTLVGRDVLGNETTVEFTLDTVKPALTVDSPESGTEIESGSTRTIVISGSDAGGLDYVAVNLYEGSTLVRSLGSQPASGANSWTGTFTIPADLDDGTYTIKAGTFDLAGNNRTVSGTTFTVAGLQAPITPQAPSVPEAQKPSAPDSNEPGEQQPSAPGNVDSGQRAPGDVDSGEQATGNVDSGQQATGSQAGQAQSSAPHSDNAPETSAAHQQRWADIGGGVAEPGKFHQRSFVKIFLSIFRYW